LQRREKRLQPAKALSNLCRQNNISLRERLGVEKSRVWLRYFNPLPIVELQGGSVEEERMRIDGNGAPPLPENGRSNQPVATSTHTSAAASGALGVGEDQAQLSGTLAQVQGLAAQVSQFPEVREEKVNALRQVVNSGGYQPSSDQVAGALFDHMIEAPAA
jgi:flagellar biosynthesis anti-sigma factor FlgM